VTAISAAELEDLAGPAVPAGACDCHAHVFGPYDRFPLSAGRPYTPSEASVDDLRALHAALGIERAVVVAASPYGTDNGALLAAVRALGDAGRGVVALDPDLQVDLETMHAAGVRGVRINLASVGASDPAAAEAALHATAARVASRGWHVDLHASLDVIAALRDAIERLPAPTVIDHFGYADPGRGPEQPGFAALCELAAAGRVYVKLSAPERLPGGDPDHPGVAALARALLDAAPDRMLWASDWPHTGGGPHGGGARGPDQVEPFRAVDDDRALDRLREWTRDDEDELRRVLVENPARLYGFPG
jgi:predicted TIM-barrel fold metal-dependent hydrolase